MDKQLIDIEHEMDKLEIQKDNLWWEMLQEPPGVHTRFDDYFKLVQEYMQLARERSLLIRLD